MTKSREHLRLIRRSCSGLLLNVVLLTQPSLAQSNANFTYDNAGRLTRADSGSAGIVLYSYDGAGNLVSRKVQAAATTSSGGPVIISLNNAAVWGSGASSIAPNTWVAIYGSNLAPAGDTRLWAASDFVNGQLPTQLDGVSATVNGKSAYVYYISPVQINILTPPDPMPGTVRVQVTNAGITSAAFNAAAEPTSPAFFLLNSTYVLAVHQNGSLIGPASLYPGLTTPAAPGEFISIYANGFGAISMPVISGSTSQFGPLPVTPVVTIGGAKATVQYAGLAATGQFQFNVVVPATARAGDNSIVVTYQGQSTQPGLFINIQ